MSTDRVEKTKNPHNLFINLQTSGQSNSQLTSHYHSDRQGHFQYSLNQQQNHNHPPQHGGPGKALMSPVHMTNRIHKQSASIGGYYPVVSESLKSPAGVTYYQALGTNSSSGSSNSPSQQNYNSPPTRSVAMTSPRYRNFSRPNTFHQTENNSLPTDGLSSPSSPLNFVENLPTPPPPSAQPSNNRSFSIRKVPQDGPLPENKAIPVNNSSSIPKQQSNWSSFVNSGNTNQPSPNDVNESSPLYNDNHNSNFSSSSTDRTPPTTNPSKITRTKTCKKCFGSISGQFVRALDSAYHIECFTCADCNNQCSSKFFPTDNPDYDPTSPMDIPQQFPLCEQCYFKRLDLLCYACNGALRGSYITALGRKYHVDHFSCSMCDTVFGPEDSYYEHGDSIYCHFHYSTLYASKCEGCKTAILKQFVEIYRGGREQQWHPECYMIFKFWNVKLCPEGAKATLNPLRPLSVTAFAPLDQVTHSQVARHEKEVEERVYNIWTVLCGYEEATASYISDMLQSASNGNYNEALNATANLVAKVDILFTALDALNLLIDPFIKEQEKAKKDDNDDEFTSAPSSFTILGREPKNLIKKIVEFMSMISRSREKNIKKMGITLLNLVTSLAHYLKILIRYGLSNSLLYDRTVPNGNAINSFLERVEVHTQSTSVLNNLDVSAMTNDRCVGCDSSVEDICIRYGDKLWHVDCLSCTKCGTVLGHNIENARWLNSEKVAVCSNCSTDSQSGFVYVTKLQQFIFLVKIAVARLQLVLSAYDARDKKSQRISGGTDSISTPSLTQYKGTSSKIRANPSAGSSSTAVNEPSQNEKGYMTTLTDIRRLRSAKLDRQVSEMSHKARQSRILAMPDSESGQMKNNNDSSNSLSMDGVRSPLSDDGGQSRRPSNQSEDKISVVDKSVPSISSQSVQTRQMQPPVSTTSSNKSLLKNAKRTFSIKRRKELKIEELSTKRDPGRLDRTTDLFRNEKSLTLDDIPRIVAAEQAREQLPNAFRHQARTTSMTNSVPMPKSISDTGVKDDAKIFISELSNSDLFFIRHVCVLLIHPLVSEWFSQEELFDLIETRRQQSIWGKFGKAFGGGGNNTSSVKKKGSGAVFGTPLEQLVEKYGVDSTLGVGPKPLRIPAFVDDCISSMRQKDMSVEGIFRKNGNIRRLKEFTEKVDKYPDQGGILSEENAIQLAALLKKFLRELPEPLMTSKLQKLWIVTQKVPDPEARKRILHLTCCLLPKTHREVMEVLFYFLNWTASFAHIDEETGSKMDAHNLATVITPNILYIKEGGHESGDAYFLSIESVNTLIEEQCKFAEVPLEALAIFKESGLSSINSDISSKDIIGKVEEYIKLSGEGVDLSRPVNDNDKSQPSTNSNHQTHNTGEERPSAIRVNTSEVYVAQPGQKASIKQVQSSELSPT